MSKLGKAIALASNVFENMYDKGGHPYILHCVRVMNNLNTDDEELKCIAILHDICEDIFKNNPERGLDELRMAGFSERVVKALDLLTHRKNVPYDDYIQIIASNIDAVKVKLADLRDNLDTTRLDYFGGERDFKRLEKYHKNFIYLKKILEKRLCTTK